MAIITLSSWRSLGYQLFLVGILCFVISKFWLMESHAAHAVALLTGLFIFYRALVPATVRNPLIILADHRIVFCASFALYFIFGASQLIWERSEILDIYFWRFTPEPNLILLADAMNFIGISVVLITSSLRYPRIFHKLTNSIMSKMSAVDSFSLLPFFMFVGGFSFVYVILQDFIFVNTVSGAFRQLSNLLLVAVLLLAMRGRRNGRLLSIGSIAIAITMSIVGLLTLSKQAIFLPIVALLVGNFIRTKSLLQFAGAMTLVVSAFIVAGGPIASARSLMEGLPTPTAAERVNYLVEGAQLASQLTRNESYSVASRFNYLHSHAGAIYFYDQGSIGSDLEKIPWVFVPRFVAPNKPIMTSSGNIFYEKMTGRSGSSESSGGVFADGYYNLGWFGVIVWSAMVGGTLAISSAIASQVLRRQSIILFPLVFMGMFMAFRIDGILLADFLGAVMYQIYIIFALFLMSLFSSASVRKVRARDA